MKRVIVTFITLLFLLIAAGAGTYAYYMNNVKNPFVEQSKVVEITVKEKESLFQLLDRLEKEKVLKNAWLSKFFYKNISEDLNIKPGLHEVKIGGDLNDLLKSLKSTDLNNRSFVIPEGLSIDEIGDIIEKSGLATKDEFIEEVKNHKLPVFVKKVEGRRYALEGFLKPDSYIFPKGTKVEAIVKDMLMEFEKSFKKAMEETGTDIPIEKWDDVIIKASMIEKETNNPEERAIVASVIENRLKKKMPLQLDATVIYARNSGKKAPTYKDLKIESPYNTYYIKGLPIGPISNPSFDSIKAVLKPEKTNYLFYILDPTKKKHYFTDNYDDFLKKKEEVKKLKEKPKVTYTSNTLTKTKIEDSTIPSYGEDKKDNGELTIDKLKVKDIYKLFIPKP